MSTAKRRGNREGSNPVQRKDGRWQVNIRYADDLGVSKRTSVTGRTPREAREQAANVRDRLSKGQPARDAKATVGAFAKDWIDSTLAASDRKLTTKDNYANLIASQVVKSKLGAVPLDRLKARHIEAWTVELRDRGLSPATINKTFRVLRLVLDTAVRDQALAFNPVKLVESPKVTKREAGYLTRDQVERLLVAASASRFQVVFALLFLTGLRRGEALALRWQDVDLDNSRVHICGTLTRVDGELVKTSPKTAKSDRWLKLSPAALSVIRQARQRQREERLRAGSVWQATGFVFTTEHGTPMDPQNVLRALRNVINSYNATCDDAKDKLPAIGLHGARHTAAALMLEADVPLAAVSAVLGHSSVAITANVYAHIDPEVVARGLDTLGDVLSG